MFTPKVLVVYGNSASILAQSNLLAHAGEDSAYEVVVARSDEEALRQIANHDFAVILLDPEAGGFETAEAIHFHPRSLAVPIIFVSARSADEIDVLKGYEKGGVSYLCAPVIPKILQAKVAVFVELAKRNMQMQHQTGQLSKLNNELQEYLNERKEAEEALRQSREELRQLASYQERIKEDERKRIAREIHDELGQNLLALRIDISMLHARTGTSHPRLNKKVHAVLDQIDSTMKSMRSIINNLRPTVLDLGLNAAIEWQVKDFQRRSGIVCDLVMQEEEMVLDDGSATALFRILQESLNNVLRHAQATRAEVDLYEEGGRLFMKIADNGVGIFPGCRRKANSFGLVGIKERISTLGGELLIETEHNRGTMLTVSIPLRRAAAEVESDDSHIVPQVRKEQAEVLQLPSQKAATARKRKEQRTRVAKA